MLLLYQVRSSLEGVKFKVRQISQQPSLSESQRDRKSSFSLWCCDTFPTWRGNERLTHLVWFFIMSEPFKGRRGAELFLKKKCSTNAFSHMAVGEQTNVMCRMVHLFFRLFFHTDGRMHPADLRPQVPCVCYPPRGIHQHFFSTLTRPLPLPPII